MRKIFALSLLLLISVVAMGETSFHGNRVVPNVVSPTVTTAAMSLYLDADGGVDTNDCTSAATPCLTYAGVLAKVPGTIRHPVDITAAAGNYAGFALPYFNVPYPANGTTGSYLQFHGTLVTATLSGAPATGTVASAANGSDPTSWSITVDGGTYVTDELKGKQLEIVSGTGSGQIYAIQYNTSTVITVTPFFSTTPTNSSTFAIRDWGTKITTAVSRPPNLFGNAVSANNAAIYIAGGSHQIGNARYFVGFEKMSMEPATGGGVLQAGADTRVTWRNSRFFTTSGSIGYFINSGNVAIDKSVFKTANTSSAAMFSTAGTDSVTRVSINGSVFLGNGVSFSTGVGLSDVFSAGVSNCYFYNLAHAFALQGPVLTSQCSNNWFDCNSVASSYAIFGQTSASAGPGQLNWGGSGGFVTRCTGVVFSDGRSVIAITGGWGGGVTTGITANNGSQVLMASGWAVDSGTTDLSIDSTAYGVSTLRAASPTSITNAATQSTVYQ